MQMNGSLTVGDMGIATRERPTDVSAEVISRRVNLPEASRSINAFLSIDTLSRLDE